MGPVRTFPSVVRAGLAEIRSHYSGRSGGTRLRRIITLGVISLCALVIYAAIGPSELTRLLTNSVETAQRHPVLFTVTLFVGWTLLFLTIAPLGSLTVMIAGFVFGPLMGVLQALSQLTASIILYQFLPKPTSDIFANSTALSSLRRRPILFVALVRLIPIMPSALSVLAYRELGIAQRPMIAGTAIAGWIRPVTLAWFASQLPNIQALLERVTQ